MGWLDYHLHAFKIKKPRGRKVWEIGIPDDEDADGVLEGWRTAVADYFTLPGTSAFYEYDFGDSWLHEVLLEGVLLGEAGAKYPRCIGGERACPPEDCGGAGGYANLLEILSDPNHEEYEEYATWLGGQLPGSVPFDPERFAASEVEFDDPYERFKMAFGSN